MNKVKQIISNSICVFIACLFLSAFSFAQDFYENKQVGIKIIKPETWILASNDDLQRSLDKIKFSEKELEKVLSSNKGVITLCTYYKYHIDSASGFIPTAKITIRINPTSNMYEFKQAMSESANQVKTVVKNFEFIDRLKEVSISNYPSLFYSCRYSLGLSNGESIKIRSRYYMIPKGIYFISISLMDNETNENCTEVFDQLITSLQLSK